MLIACQIFLKFLFRVKIFFWANKKIIAGFSVKTTRSWPLSQCSRVDFDFERQGLEEDRLFCCSHFHLQEEWRVAFIWVHLFLQTLVFLSHFRYKRYNEFGSLGNGDHQHKANPTLVMKDEEIKEIACGRFENKN